MRKWACVYVLRLEDGNFKIGATNDLHGRLQSHRREARLPPFELRHTIESDDPKRAERYLHGALSGYCAEGEVFALSPEALEWLLSLKRLDRDFEPTPPSTLAPRKLRKKAIKRGLFRGGR